MYDHRIEVRNERTYAANLRAQARRLRENAEHHALQLEAAASRCEARAEHVHHLCTRGGDATCCGAT